jgi:hypothetical protein
MPIPAGRPMRTTVCGMLVAAALTASAAPTPDPYASFSRLTDPKDYSFMLSRLPDDPAAIAAIAKQQTIHHNLLAYFNVPPGARPGMQQRLRGTSNVLRALSATGPRNLYDPRAPEQRVIGACFLESHLLAGMMRYKHIPVRLRAGYFKDIRDPAHHEHILEFWEKNLEQKRMNAGLLDTDPQEWKRQVDAYSASKNAINHYIEHWIAQYWDADQKRWRLLDANDTFLLAHSGMHVGFHLPPEHFQFAHEAWKKMRTDPAFNPRQYEEDPLDGRSHIRMQMLSDFYTLLNHDGAGGASDEESDRQFLRERTYRDLSREELAELDALAALLAGDPPVHELVRFYRSSRTLHIKGAESDRYSFVYTGA